MVTDIAMVDKNTMWSLWQVIGDSAHILAFCSKAMLSATENHLKFTKLILACY